MPTLSPDIDSIFLMPESELELWPDNYNEGDVGLLMEGIGRYGFAGAIKVWNGNQVRGGNHTLIAVRALKASGEPLPHNIQMLDGEWYVPCVSLNHLTEQEAIGFAIFDNRSAARASQNEELLLQYLGILKEADETLVTGYDDADMQQIAEFLSGDIAAAGGGAAGEDVDTTPRASLAERFIVPPFSILDARQGYWQLRKKAWIALGIQGELGRGATNTPGSAGDHREGRESGEYAGGHAWLGHKKPHAAPGGSEMPAATPSAGRGGKIERGDGYGRPLKNGKTAGRTFGQDLMRGEHVVGQPTKKPKGLLGGSAMNGEWVKKVRGEDFNGLAANSTGTSIFDPVLCELVYRWFNVPNGKILDPFAGESTKGIVATKLGYSYMGVELRQEQVDANYRQAEKIGVTPMWVCSDSAKLNEAIAPELKYDLIFTSPPYYDLEIYSESDKDGSAFETYPKFMAWYKDIFEQAISHLNDNRFLVVKVGEIRDKKGVYRNFVGDNIQCFIDLGLNYYNEMILVTTAGSLPIRINKQFTSARKIGKTHQNILCFYKGDSRKIKDYFPKEIEHGDVESATSENAE